VNLSHVTDADLCKHDKLFCMICDFEFIVIATAARESGHERECQCRRCAIIRRDIRRANRKATIEAQVVWDGSTVQVKGGDADDGDCEKQRSMQGVPRGLPCGRVDDGRRQDDPV
jgi:hypothetical protein